MKLSIIVPVYQVEQYIRACVESIFQQHLDDADYEVVLVDDGTKDNSFGVIKDLTDSHCNIVVVSQENQGLSAARNTGLARATGDYVLFLDSDDLLVSDSLRPLLRDAEQHHPDMLVAGFVKLTDKEIASGQGECAVTGTYSSEVKTGREVFLSDFTPRECYVWRTIYRRAFLDDNSLRFIPGIYFEDVPFTTACYLKAGRCIITAHTFYVYRQRQGSICSAISKRKVMDFNKVLASLWEMRDVPGMDKPVSAQLMNTIFTTFNIEVFYITHNDSLMAERHDIMQDLRKRVPGLHFTGGPKQLLVSWFYRLMPDTYIAIRQRLSFI